MTYNRSNCCGGTETCGGRLRYIYAVIAIAVRLTPKRIIQKFIGRYFSEFQAAAYMYIHIKAAAIALSNSKLIN